MKEYESLVSNLKYVASYFDSCEEIIWRKSSNLFGHNLTSRTKENQPGGSP